MKDKMQENQTGIGVEGSTSQANELQHGNMTPASPERGSWQQCPHTRPVAIVLNLQIQLCRNDMAFSSWEVTSTLEGDGSQAKVSDTMSASHHPCGEKGR